MSLDTQMLKALVVDGMQSMYGPKTRAMFLKAVMADPKAIPENLAREIAGIIRLLDEKAKGKLPKNLFVPVAAALIADALDFLERTGEIPEADDMMQPAIAAFIQAIVPEYQGGGQAPQQAAPGGPPAAPAAPPQAQGMIGGAQ